ncbi:hypothetical protein BVY01_02895 [bacterium I07]|nr:hypothetical protein BVY01_02895 [bacterium I07]
MYEISFTDRHGIVRMAVTREYCGIMRASTSIETVNGFTLSTTESMMFIEMRKGGIMGKFIISWFDKNGALRTGLTDPEDFTKEGVWINYQGKRIFVKRERLRKVEQNVQND